MFYVKSKLNDEVEIKIEINDENTYTNCPECGAEVQVDLSDMTDERGYLDLFGTSCYCRKCSEKMNADNTYKPRNAAVEIKTLWSDGTETGDVYMSIDNIIEELSELSQVLHSNSGEQSEVREISINGVISNELA